MDGVHPRINVDAGKWGATVAVLRGLRRLEVGWMDDYMVPALSALTGLTSLHLGLRTGPLLLPVCCDVAACPSLTLTPTPTPTPNPIPYPNPNPKPKSNQRS